MDFYRAIAAQWGAALRLGGALLFEVGIGQAGDVGAILAQNQFEQIQTFPDTQGTLRNASRARSIDSSVVLKE